MRLGIDIGGTTIKYGIVSNEGKIIESFSFDTKVNDGYLLIVNNIISQVLIIKEKYKIDSIGIGVPGIVDKNGEIVKNCPNLFWKNVTLGKDIEFKTGIKTYVENDANIALLAEHAFGNAKGYSDVIMLTLGTGVGGAAIVDGKLLKGSRGYGTEFGHIYVGENKNRCNCGKYGCLESFVSATGIIRYAQNLYDKNQISTRVKSAKQIFESEDTISKKAIERVGYYLAVGIGNLIQCFNPECVIIGGGLSGAKDKLLNSIERNISSQLGFFNKNDVEIAIAKWGNRAGIIGASILSEYRN